MMNRKRKASFDESVTGRITTFDNTRTVVQAEGNGTIELLNQELLLGIFSWLLLEDVNECMLVCRKWNVIASDNKVSFTEIFDQTA